MIVTVNGDAREVAGDITVLELIGSLGIPTARIAVEVNREIVPKSMHDTHRLAEGDRLEIVTMVGGG